MNSTISDDFSNEHLVSNVAKCIENIQARTVNLEPLHKELLEINLSITAYIEESKRRLEEIRLSLADEARSSEEKITKMSNPPSSPRKRSSRVLMKAIQEDNNNTSNKFSAHQQARIFMQWYKHMIDDERQNFTLYISDDAVLEWFGKTIKTRKKVSAFLKYDMQCSKHDFTTIESIEKIQSREEALHRQEDTTLASPLQSPELIQRPERSLKRRLRSNCNSPEWADGCQPNDDESSSIERKRLKRNQLELVGEEPYPEKLYENDVKKCFSGDADEPLEISNKGDGALRNNRLKRRLVVVTPPNREVGQGDCMPSTSGTDSDKSHKTLNAQLPKLAVECNGYIEFTRTRNNRSVDAMKWERKCKVQISYSKDPLNVGEYIIWCLRYTDESKCRRNLLAAFEEVSKEEELKNV